MEKKEEYLRKIGQQQENQLCRLQVMNERLRKLESYFYVLENQNNDSFYNILNDQSDLKSKILSIIQTALSQEYPDGEILFIYLWGSRFLGIADIFSDWDFLVVMNRIEQKSLDSCTLSLNINPNSIEKIQKIDFNNIECINNQNNDINPGIDIAVYSKDFWQSLLDNHESWILPFWYDYPQEMIWYQEKKVNEIFKFKLSYLQLKHSIFETISTNWGQTKTFYISGSIRKAKKRVSYTAVALYYSIQILQKGTIYDRHPCKQFFEMILFRHFSSWDQFFNEINNNYILPLTKEFKSLVSASRKLEQYVAQNILPKKADPFNYMFVYLQYFMEKLSFEELESHLSIISKPHPQVKDLIQLDSQYPLYSSPTSMVCNSVLINKDTKEIIAAANSFTPEWTTLEKFSKKTVELHEPSFSLLLDWNSGYTCYEEIDGTPVLLFHYNGEWIVSKIDLPPYNYTPKISNFNSYNSNNLSNNNPNILKNNNDNFNNNENNIIKKKENSIIELFWSLWKELNYKLPNFNEDKCCYVFKIVHPLMTNFTHYERSHDLILFSVRKLVDNFLHIEPLEIAKKNGWHTHFRTFSIKKQKLSGSFPTDWMNLVENLHPIECKGFLFVGSNQRRLKLISPSWKSLKKLSNLDPSHPETLPVAKEIFFEIIMSFPDMGKLLIDHFPPSLLSFWPLCNKMVLKIQELTNEIQTWFDEIKNHPDYSKLVNKYDFILPPKYLKPLREGKQFKTIKHVLSYFYSKTFSKSYKKQVQKWGKNFFENYSN